MTIKRRIERLEREGPVQGEVVFISTGVPRHDKMGRLDVAITPQGWLAKRPYESDENFESRANRGSC
jgi:hypothetical protein